MSIGRTGDGRTERPGGADHGEPLEREAELAALQASIESARKGSGSLAVVEGQAGIGKTCLVDVVRGRARDAGLTVCGARAGELDRDFPFGVVSQLLEPAVMALSVEGRATLFSGSAAPASHVLLGGDLDASAPDASFAILRGLYRVLAALAEHRPAVLLVDDLQWCDRPSLRFLTYLAKRLEDLPVCVIVALRSAEAGAPNELLDELRLDPHATVLTPKPLSVEAVRAVVRTATAANASDELCRACHRATGGNPLYLRELLRTLGDRDLLQSDDAAVEVERVGPDSISRFVLRRLASLDSSAPQLARAMAVLGSSAPLRIAAELAGIERSAAGALARSLRFAEILSSEDPFAFVHPVVRQAIYVDMPAQEIDELHLSAARLLESADAPVDEVAAHLLLVKPARREWCVEALRRAARDALARGAPEVAVSYLQRALNEGSESGIRTDVLRELAHAEEHGGDPAALGHLNAALEATDDPRERGEIAIELGRTLEAFSRGWEALDTLWAVRDELNDLPGAEELVQRVELAALSAGMLGGKRLDQRLLEVLLRYMQNVPDGPGGQVALSAGALAAGNGGAYEQGLSMLRRALGLIDVEQANWDPAGTAIWVTICGERFDEVRAFLEPALLRLRELGHARGLMTAEYTFALLHHRLGELAEAESYGLQALEIAQRAQGFVVPWPLVVLLDVWLDQGDLDAAERALELLPSDDWAPYAGFIFALAGRGRLRCAQADFRRGLEDLLTAARLGAVETLGVDLGSAAFHRWRSSAALASLHLGELDRANELADAELSEARAIDAAVGAPRALGMAQRAAGLVRGGEDGLELLEQSVATLEKSPAALERAYSLVELGAALRRMSSRAAARDPLRRGLELALRSGAAPLVTRAREELAASGAKPRRDAVTGRDALTPSERRVARLAADEMSNREIAQALYLSVRTVEMHLGRAYRKLGISSRRELAGALAEAA